MELWIRSQDKEDFLEVHNLGLAYKGKYGFMDKIGDIDGYCICEFINDYHVKLGTYRTKERALEVLDEIQKLIKPTLKINYEYDDSQPIIDGEWLKSLKAENKIEELSCYAYEMPEE